MGLPYKSIISISPFLLPFLRKVLDQDPARRATAQDCLKDGWLAVPNKRDGDNNVISQRHSVKANVRVTAKRISKDEQGR